VAVGLKSPGDKNNCEELESRIKYAVLRSLKFNYVRNYEFDLFAVEQQIGGVRQRLGSTRYSREEKNEILVDSHLSMASADLKSMGQSIFPIFLRLRNQPRYQ